MTPAPAKRPSATATAPRLSDEPLGMAPAVPLVSASEPAAEHVIEALRRVMRDLPAIGKEGTGPSSQGSYKFRGVEQIVRHAVPLFAKHGVLFTPHRVDLREHTDVISGGKPATDERVLVTFRIYGPGGAEDYIEVQAPGVGRDSSDKGSNKAMTAAYKYALTQTLGIADAKDDGDSTSMETDYYEPPELASEDSLTMLADELAAYLVDNDGEYPGEWKAGPLPIKIESLEAMLRGEKRPPTEADVRAAFVLVQQLRGAESQPVAAPTAQGAMLGCPHCGSAVTSENPVKTWPDPTSDEDPPPMVAGCASCEPM